MDLCDTVSYHTIDVIAHHQTVVASINLSDFNVSTSSSSNRVESVSACKLWNEL